MAPGTALAPELTLWSNPSLDQAEQLSYLVLGRPLRSASEITLMPLPSTASARPSPVFVTSTTESLPSTCRGNPR